MIVHLDGRPLRFFPGATVRDLAGRLSDEAFAAWRCGAVYLADEDGHEVGEGGGLSDGARYRVVSREAGRRG